MRHPVHISSEYPGDFMPTLTRCSAFSVYYIGTVSVWLERGVGAGVLPKGA
jgi:hypothetical protein